MGGSLGSRLPSATTCGNKMWQQNGYRRHLPKSRRFAGSPAVFSGSDFAKALANEYANFGSEDALLHLEKALRYVSSELFRYRRRAAVEFARAPGGSLGGRVALLLEIRA